MTQQSPPEPLASESAVSLGGSEITTTDCRQCGAQVSGLNNRYACSYCGWVNHWAEGSSNLPAAQDDPDYPGL
jgi:ribosomal protein L37E